jgi:carbamoyl-phosphate synthase large subunit
MRIMMSAAASPVAPSIIRWLQVLGHQVIGHDSEPYFHCDICDRFLRSPTVGGHYLNFLRNFEGSYDFYLPFLDEELHLFAMKEYPASCLASPSGTLLIFTDKAAQQEALENAGIPIAPCDEVIIKPRQGRGGKGTIRIKGNSDFIVQRLIKGVEYTIDVLVDLDGKFLFAVPRKRLIANGVSIIGRIEMNIDLIELAEEVVGKFKFAGPINIQVMSNPEKDYLIEVNPRLSGSCIMTCMAGWDILDAIVRLWEGKRFVAPDKINELTIRRHYVEERV